MILLSFCHKWRRREQAPSLPRPGYAARIRKKYPPRAAGAWRGEDPAPRIKKTYPPRAAGAGLGADKAYMRVWNSAEVYFFQISGKM